MKRCAETALCSRTQSALLTVIVIVSQLVTALAPIKTVKVDRRSL